MQPPRSKWAEVTEANPGHSAWYVQRFRNMAAAGADLVGEARLVDALSAPGSTVMDAGCGPGRHAGYLHQRGHTVVGLDLDPVLIEAAEDEFPGPSYLVADLAAAVLPADLPQSFDIVLCAGQVMSFLHPQTRRPVLSTFASWLAPQGRALIGFGAGRGYEFEDFFADAEASGLVRHNAFSTWDLRPYTPDSTFLVALLGRAQ